MGDLVSGRTCRVCREFKEAPAYRVLRTVRGVRYLSSRCKACDVQYQSQRMESDVNRRRKAINARARRRVNGERVLQYLKAHPCVDCGQRDPVVLDFDHRDIAAKRTEIGKLVVSASWGVLFAEIAKCDVRCANCHRRRTAAQFGWHFWRGRDHVAEAAQELRELLEAVGGQRPLFEEDRNPVVKQVLLTNLAEMLNRPEAGPKLFEEGECVTVIARVRVEQTESHTILIAQDAVFVDPGIFQQEEITIGR